MKCIGVLRGDRPKIVESSYVFIISVQICAISVIRVLKVIIFCH